MDAPKDALNPELDQESEAPQEAPDPIDAVIHVTISEDALTAHLMIEPPQFDGDPPTLHRLKSALFEHHVSQHIDTDLLQELEENPVYNNELLVASGVAPVDGIDGTMTLMFDTEKQELLPQEVKNGFVDYRVHNTAQSVKKHQILCKMTPPTEGTPGSSVQGKGLPQKKGKLVMPVLGQNTKLNDNGSAVLSTVDGQVSFDGKKISVTDVLYINGDVDFSTGNIDVPNNLVIYGMVLPGFELKASGNIEVQGVVQNATITAGGNVTLGSGFIGSTMHCGGDFHSKYIDNCDVFTRGDIQSTSIVNSRVQCGRSIKLIGVSSKIIGGHYVVGQNIETQTIGSAANIKTTLDLNTNFSVIEQQQRLLKDVAEMEAQNAKLEPIITLLKQLQAAGRLTEDKEEALRKAISSFYSNKGHLAKAHAELEEINKLLENHEFGRIICRGAVHPGTQINIGKAVLSLTRTLEKVTLYYEKGEIATAPVY